MASATEEWNFKFYLIVINNLNNHMWLVAAVLASTAVEYPAQAASAL